MRMLVAILVLVQSEVVPTSHASAPTAPAPETADAAATAEVERDTGDDTGVEATP